MIAIWTWKVNQWVFAEELVNILGCFEVTTTFHSYEENPSISVLLVLFGMVENLSDDSPTIAQLKHVSCEITWRWELECLDTSFIICSGGSSLQANKLPQWPASWRLSLWRRWIPFPLLILMTLHHQQRYTCLVRTKIHLDPWSHWMRRFSLWKRGLYQERRSHLPGGRALFICYPQLAREWVHDACRHLGWTRNLHLLCRIVTVLLNHCKNNYPSDHKVPGRQVCPWLSYVLLSVVCKMERTAVLFPWLSSAALLGTSLE